MRFVVISYAEVIEVKKTWNIEDRTLYSDDTFTLAFGDPDTEMEESTPYTLARAFALQSLEELRDSLALRGLQRWAAEIEKLEMAIDIANINGPWAVTVGKVVA